MNKDGQRPAAIAFILVTLFIDILGIGIVIPVLPELVKQFVGGDKLMAIDDDLEAGSITEEQAEERHKEITAMAAPYVGIIAVSYALMQFLCAPVMGALSDRFGRRPILLAALFGLGVDFLIQGLAPTIGWLFVGRILAGAMGASFTTANAYIADVSSPENRARNFGLMGVMFGLGFTFGPALGGLLGGINLRLPFFVSAGLALVNWLYGYFVLPESLPKEKRSKFKVELPSIHGPIVRLRQYPIVGGLAVAFLCMSLAQRGLENVWVLFTSHQFGWNEKTNGLTLGLVGIMAIIVQGGMVRPTIKRFGERKTVIIGLVVSALAFVGYGLATEGWMVWLIIVFGSFGGVTGPAIQSIVAASVEPTEQGRVQGALTSLVSITNILAPGLFTAGLFTYFTSKSAVVQLPGAPFLAGSLLLVAALFVVRVVFRRIPEAIPDDPQPT